jgi:hypothetical protein
MTAWLGRCNLWNDLAQRVSVTEGKGAERSSTIRGLSRGANEFENTEGVYHFRGEVPLASETFGLSVESCLGCG